MSNESQFIKIFEAQPLQEPEFRLYYDEQGKVICYTSEKLPGNNFIIIDARTYAEGRPDIRVVNGKLSRINPNLVISKLIPNSEGIDCAYEDMSIITNETDLIKKQKWKLKTYEINR